jgi:hypothetical protein
VSGDEVIAWLDTWGEENEIRPRMSRVSFAPAALRDLKRLSELTLPPKNVLLS